MAHLTQKQREAAAAMFRRRPTVIPGTRAILSDTERKLWFLQVTDTMLEHHVTTPYAIAEFCDLAGVPD